MKRNCEDEPLGLIELCEYAFEAYEILQTHYENRMVSDLGVIISGVTRSSYSENITIEAHIQDFEQKWKKMATIGSVDEENQEFARHIQGLGKLESAKKEFLLMTFPTHIPRYAQLVQNLRSQKGYSYGDLVANLKIYVPQIGWKKKSHQGAWTGSKTDPVVLKADTRGPLDTSKNCRYCKDVKGWRGIGHTERECRTKKRESSNQGSGSEIKKIDSKPFEESEDEFELDQGARITEIHNNRRFRVNMIKAGRITHKRTGQYEFDTGAQVHTTNELWRLRPESIRPGKTITACNGTKTTAMHEGTLEMMHNGRQIILKNVLYHPNFYNLISGQKVPGIELRDLEGLKVLTNGEVIYSIERDSGTMWIKPTDTNVPVNKVTLMELHERYGHISFDTLKSLPEAQKYRNKTIPKCKACIAGKSTKPAAKPVKQPRSNRILERIHMDLIGPLKPWLGKTYILTMMDDHSRYCTAIPIKDKTEASEKAQEWILAIQTSTEKKVGNIQADWGTEFTKLRAWGRKNGIQSKDTIPYHSETHGTIERLNRTLQDMARTAMISAEIKGLWGDAIQWAAYTKNRIPHKALQKKSPIEILLQKPSDRTNLRPFGQKVMIHVYKEERADRMAPRTLNARIIGYTTTHGTYQVITPTGKRKIAKNPKPIDQASEESDNEEHDEWLRKPVQDLEDIAKKQPGRNYGWHCPEERNCPKGSHTEDQEYSEKPQSPPDSPSQQLIQEQQNQEPPAAPSKPKAQEPLRRSERMGRDLTNWQDRINQGLAGEVNRVGHNDDHPTDEQARSHPTKAREWAKARQTEREKLQKYRVYTVVQKHMIPEGVHPVDTKWVYDVKKDNKGNITRYRARKVGRGFTQEYGLNYHETFSQMARSESWRVLLTLAINHGWTVLQWDVKAAYLQADLDPKHQIYVKDLTESGETEYWKLHKALYGLKQAGHQWYNRMRTIMTKAGYTQCTGDPGCFYHSTPSGIPKAIISTHVDDMAGYGTPEALLEFEKAVELEVELEKLGQPTKLLGMELTWEKDNKSVKLTQTDTIEKLAKEHKIPSIPNRTVPLNQEGYAEPSESEVLTDPTKYQSLVGSLLYINRMTRPNISVHVNLLVRRTSKPGTNNMKTALQVGQYLASTKNEGLLITISQKESQEARIDIFADASYGGENSRSQSGTLATLYGTPIMWNARRQDVVSMSITEAEYIACSEAAKDAQWIRQLLKELNITTKPRLHTDNEAALKLTKTQTFHRRTRHIEHRYHYIRELVDQNSIQIIGIKGKINPADPLTKLLPMSSIGRWKQENYIG